MRTILLVDDEAAARYGTGRALEKQYKVIEAASAAAAREALAASAPDLILLDLVMPGEDGLSFLRWLRENGHEAPVLVVSALDTAKTAVEALGKVVALWELLSESADTPTPSNPTSRNASPFFKQR